MQTRMSSLTEQVLSTATGFVLSSLCWWLVICPLYGFEYHVHENLSITAIFTVLSIARGYVWRRVFNRRITRE